MSLFCFLKPFFVVAILAFQLIGWFFFGSFLIVKGAVLNSLNDGRSFDGLDLADEFESKNVSSVGMYKVPWLEVSGLFLYTYLNIKSITIKITHYNEHICSVV